MSVVVVVAAVAVVVSVVVVAAAVAVVVSVVVVVAAVAVVVSVVIVVAAVAVVVSVVVVVAVVVAAVAAAAAVAVVVSVVAVAAVATVGVAVVVKEVIKLQALVYDILPSTLAAFSYAIGSRNLSANGHFYFFIFGGAQTVVSVLQTTQIISNICFMLPCCFRQLE